MAHPAYRAQHQAIRAQLLAMLAATGPWPCPRCGKPMVAGMDLDLGHSIDGDKMAGRPGDRLEHSRCNRRAGQLLSAAARRGRPRLRPPRRPRIW